VSVAPVRWQPPRQFVYISRINQEFSRSHSATARDAGSDQNEAISVGINESRDNGVVFVGFSLHLLRTVQHPLPITWFVSVLDPEFGHIWIVRKMEAQRRR